MNGYNGVLIVGNYVFYYTFWQEGVASNYMQSFSLLPDAFFSNGKKLTSSFKGFANHRVMPPELRPPSYAFSELRPLWRHKWRHNEVILCGRNSEKIVLYISS